ncbi:MAG: Pyridoxamine 5'-phosphate oxidase [Chloroflexi bacterium]|jgi:general stress protein 26|nr:MAG: Pyridoxamine 5'-phosphate oxidase [Chloroflexota bacterium]
MPFFNNSELTSFLNENAKIMRLSTLEADGYPSVTPVWFEYADSTFKILGRKQNKWVNNIRKEARVGACVDTSNAPYARVIIKAEAEIIDDNWFGDWISMATRYLGEEKGNEYYNSTKSIGRVLIKIKPIKTISWYGSDWHPKYYEDFGRPSTSS